MDTFRIKIKQDKLLVKDVAFFNEIKSSQFSNSPNHKHEKTNNAFRNELADKGIYTPKFHLSDVDFGIPDNALVLEFSAPKLLYGTNLKEVSEKDFTAVVDKLKIFLKAIGIGAFETHIRNAPATLTAYARNIPVGQFGKAAEILRVVAPFDYRPRSQFNNVIFRQGVITSELKYFNKHSHLVLYDKLTEILNNPMTDQEKRIADYLKYGTNKTELEAWVKQTLRVELTLHKKSAVKQAMAKYYGQKNDYTFEEVFKDQIRDDLLKTEIDNIFNHPLKEIILLSIYERDTFNAVIDQYAKTFSQRAEIRFMLDVLYSRGLNALREEIVARASERTWFRKQKQLKVVSEQIQLPQGITQLDNAAVLEYLLAEFGITSKLKAPKQLTLLG